MSRPLACLRIVKAYTYSKLENARNLCLSIFDTNMADINRQTDGRNTVP